MALAHPLLPAAACFRMAPGVRDIRADSSLLCLAFSVVLFAQRLQADVKTSTLVRVI